MSDKKTESNDYTLEDCEQINMEFVNEDIKEWLMTDCAFYKKFFKEVTREEEFMVIKEAVSDLLIEK
ncbi:hypothetical protein [Bacillus zhangzhouensis]|uniref:hypothetical protein n=1 Tax=Bacillus zhangzhouensis TaxID=1178540 RepID=UPI002813169E|nr:hypothetical protein [Bacillus zhangzhouensis]MDR0127264.1 hypothetical protein [Bacillus zhangzhouensis]